MVNLDITKEKQLTFEVQIGGVDFDKIQSFFRLVIEDIEYGFQCQVMKDSIMVTLPPLKKIIGEKIKEVNETDIKLDVIADGYYLTPWKDRAKLFEPVVVEAKIKDDSIVKKPKIETKLIVEDGTALKEATPTNEHVEKLLEDTIKKVNLAETVKPKKKQLALAEFKRNLSKEDIYKYIEKVGTKNPKIQDIIYDQAIAEAGSGKPIEILRHVIKVMKKQK